MKRQQGLWFWSTLLLFGMCVCLKSSVAMDVYVSTSGDDANPGTRDQPVASFEAAKKLARKSAGKEAVTIHIGDGTYFLRDTLKLSHADSGTAENPVVWKAENEGGAIISGGVLLKTDWQSYRDGIFKTKVPAGLEIDQVFVAGKRQHMARYPDYDPNATTKAWQGFSADAFSPARAARWKDPEGGFIHAMHKSRWGGYHYRITGKKADGSVSYEGGWQNNRPSGMHKNFRMVENIFEELDVAGEWFHDADTRMLYYFPAEGIDLATDEVVVVRLEHLIELNGSEKQPVANVSFDGFVLRHAARTFMKTKEPLLRSDWTIYRGGCVKIDGCEQVTISNCEFDQPGGNAIFVSNYNRSVTVRGCHIHDAGASGVCFVGDPDAVRNPLFSYGDKNDLNKIDLTPGPKTNNYPADCKVTDCLINGIGRVERQPAGVQISMASRITVGDCSIYDCARAGINVSEGTWGGHLIEGCDVFDTVLETHDHGSFNSWGRDRFWRRDNMNTSDKAVQANPKLPFLDAKETTVIRNSRWRCDHGWDIDLDDGSSNYEIYNNLMLAGGLKFREGFGRKAYNNVIVNNGLHPHVWYNNSDSSFERNIAMGRHRNVRCAKGWQEKIDRNAYDSTELLKKNQKMGGDGSSVAGDLKFIDPANGDFRVQQDSPALKIGFVNFPMDKFGVKKPSLRAIAKTPVIPKLKTPMQASADGAQSGSPKGQEYWLGATIHSLVGEEYSAFGVSKEDLGVQFVAVPKGSVAEKVGIQKDDVIQRVGDSKVRNSKELFVAWHKARSKAFEVSLVRNQKPLTVNLDNAHAVLVEPFESAEGSDLLKLSQSVDYKVTTKPATKNQGVAVLSDGSLAEGYGPIFGNGTAAGYYRFDLGDQKSVKAVSLWTFQQGKRGAVKVNIYGSASGTDPGFNVSKFTPLSTLDTRHLKQGTFNAVSLRTREGTPLGSFRWIMIESLPVTGGGEHTAFQEIRIEP